MAAKANKNRHRTIRSALLSASILSFLPILGLMKANTTTYSVTQPLDSVQLAAAAPGVDVAGTTSTAGTQAASTTASGTASSTSSSQSTSSQSSSTKSQAANTYTRTKAS
jgi:hypothetical protein